MNVPHEKTSCCIIPLLLLTCVLSPLADGNDDKPSTPGIAIGIGCITGGAIFSIYNYTRAKAEYERYRKSAFTDNTKELRREVRRRDLFCVLGAVASGLGLVTVVVSF